jgi:hypothetical protein
VAAAATLDFRLRLMTASVVVSGDRAGMPFSRAGNQGRVVGVDDRIEQAREAAVEVFLAELHVAPGALDALGDQPRLAHVAAPSLQRDLHVSDAALQLIVGGYAFMYASGMVTGGRLGDLLGYRRLFMAGVASFAVASLLCGLAQSPVELVIARLLQGLTGAAMVPQVLALITATFPVRERSRALAWFGVDSRSAAGG